MAGLFDPSSFSGSQAGLYGRLAAIAQQPSPSGVLPGRAGTDAMASGAPQPQAPQTGAPQGGGFLDGLMSFLSNHQNAMMGLGAGIASGGLQRGVPGMVQGNQQDYQLRILQGTMRILQSKGYSPQDAYLIATNPKAMEAFSGNYAPQTYSSVDMNDPNAPTGKSTAILGSRTGMLAPAIPIPPAAVQKLQANRNNPQAIPDFDRVFGPRSAAKSLGGY